MSNTRPIWTDPFLAALREYPVLRFACEQVGIDRATAFRRRQTDKDFDAAVREAMQDGIDRAEQEAFRRAVLGFEEPVIYKGQLCYTMLLDENRQPVRDARGEYIMVPLTIRKHSDQMLALVLQGRRKEIYAMRTELTGADGAPVAIDPTARAARAAQLLEAARQRKDAEGIGGEFA